MSTTPQTSQPNHGPYVALLLVAAVLAGAWFLFHGPGTLPPITTNRPPNEPIIPGVKIKLYLFTSKTCEPCKQLKQNMKDSAVVEALKRFDLVEVQNDRGREKLYKVKSYPTLVAVSGQGVSLHAGLLAAPELAAWLNGVQ